LLVENDWDPANVPVAECLELLSLVLPSPIILHTLYTLSSGDELLAGIVAAARGGVEPAPTHISLDPLRVSMLAGLRCVAESESGQLREDKLVELWKDKLPSSIPVDIGLLEVNRLRYAQIVQLQLFSPLVAAG
jgi:hypothetical protein